MPSAIMEPPAVVDRPHESAIQQAPPDIAISELIDRARSAPAGVMGALALSILAGLLFWGAFFPIDFGPLAWIAPVPLLMLARLTQPTRRMYLAVTAGGLVFWGMSLQWMRLGHESMYIAWGALATYLTLYFPVFLGCVRMGVHRLHLPLTLVAPVVWVALEYLRGYLMTGFSWYLIGHSQHDWTSLIQICDVTGVYGVSFLILLSAAALTNSLPGSLFRRLRLLPQVEQAPGIAEVSQGQMQIGLICSIAVVGVSSLYGVYRLNHAELTAGPRVALVQGNFTSEVKHDPERIVDMYQQHRQMSGKAAQFQPDLIVWPETMFPFPMLQAEPSLTLEQLKEIAPHRPPSSWRDPRLDVFVPLRDRAEEAGTSLIIGLDSAIATADGVNTYNSAVLVKPQQGVAGRYDKIHRVPFGEYVPLRDSLPFLQNFSPYGPDSGLSAGGQAKVFEVGQWRLMPMICFENSVPHLVRQMVNSCETDQPVDLLVELTNDGWFHESSQLDQHLITALFRCVETRKPLVRAVNTGISGLIDSNGIVREASEFVDYDRLYLNDDGKPRTTMRSPETGRFYKGLNAIVVVDVPIDTRSSLYLRFGDWLAAGCLVLTIAGMIILLQKSRIIKTM